MEELRARGPVLGTATDVPIDIDGPDISGLHGRQANGAGSTRQRRREATLGSISPKSCKAQEVMAASAIARTELDKQMLGNAVESVAKGKAQVD